MKGEFDIATHAMAVQSELMNNNADQEVNEYKYPTERKSLKSFKMYFSC